MQREWRPPYFVRGYVNRREANESQELWFSRRRGAVFAHADTYCTAAVSLQLSGRKRWRLMPAPPIASSADLVDYHDGRIYGSGKWRPAFEGTVEEGEATPRLARRVPRTRARRVGRRVLPRCTRRLSSPRASSTRRLYRRRATQPAPPPPPSSCSCPRRRATCAPSSPRSPSRTSTRRGTAGSGRDLAETPPRLCRGSAPPTLGRDDVPPSAPVPTNAKCATRR